jgi:toxin-antitoxin system PIN domain toxin
LILLDANILLYAYWPRSEHHDRARKWLEATVTSGSPVWLSWPGILAFLRISTDARLSARPMRMKDAAAAITALLEQSNISVLSPESDHWRIFSSLLEKAQVRGALVTDAHLAALALEHGASLATNDLDFRRFNGLKLLYPLTEPSVD